MRGLDILCCPVCRAQLKYKEHKLRCPSCRRMYLIRDGIATFIPKPSADKVSHKKWDKFYKSDSQKDPDDTIEAITKRHIDDALRQIAEVKPKKNMVFMEIGCGKFLLGPPLSGQSKLVIGIDLSLEALKLAKLRLKRRGVKNYLLIQADIRSMPIKDNALDFIYGGGVIEHFPDTQRCINELCRVLKKGGMSFNSVPMLNIGSLTYRQRWGNIPNLVVLKQIAEFIHMHLLGARHMTYGYEMSFLPGTLYRLHKAAKFRHVTVDKYSVELVFEFVPRLFRPWLIWLANKSPLFWPMIKVIAIK